MEPITTIPRIPTSFRVNSPNVKYTAEHIISDYQYKNTKTRFENGELIVEPTETNYTFKTERKVPKLGVMIVGLGGNNGSTVVAGAIANREGISWHTKSGVQHANYYGSMLLSSTVRLGANEKGEDVYIPFSSLLPTVHPNDMVFGGWDINGANLAEAMERAQVLDYDLQRQLVPHMKAITPLPSIYYPDFIAANQADRANHLIPGSKKEQLEKLRQDIRDFKKNSNVDKVIILAKDKRIVDEPSSTDDVWWGPVNIKLDDTSFLINRERAVDYLNTRDQLYIVDGYAGWDPKYSIKVRIVCERAYHALFMNNMLIRPTREQLATFGEPDYVIYNAGSFPANRYTKGMTSSTSVGLHFGRKEMVILGSQYAGEMKKGVLTIMMYLMPKMGALPLHSSANEGEKGDVTLFFGLSGTGKTTLSADPKRALIGDDEHVWTDTGVFNIEGGCYAKCINLTEEKEPEIFRAIRFGAVLENVVYDDHTREVDYTNISLTENTRCAYPLEFIPNAKIPAVGGHPKNIVLLTCDAFGVLPPVSKLTKEQVMYHFISGYTSKIPGTEMGVTEPTVTFSSCYAQPFIVWHPTKYAQMLAEKLEKYSATAWLVNTGWTGGAYGTGSRCSLKYTRAIIDAIHSGELHTIPTTKMDVFGLEVPVSCPGVPEKILMPRNAWADTTAYDAQLGKLAAMFVDNFKKYEEQSSAQVISAGPTL